MKEVVIAGYLRTAQTRSRPADPGRDWFGGMRADDLLAKLLRALVDNSGIDGGEIDDFIVGCATGVTEQWTYGGRNPIFLANLPETIPAKFIDQQCGSAMAGLHVGFMEIAMDFADIVLVGGMEHMTRVPMGGALMEKGAIVLNDALFSDPSYQHWDMATTMNMGLTAEKLFSRSDCSREEMDRWALRSHQLATAARRAGFFEDEILPIDAEQADGTVMRVDRDQSVRENTTLEGLSQLKPVFKKDGVITAGVSSPLNAGATAMLLMSGETARKKGITPLAVIRSIGFAGVDPTIMGQGPVPATEKALKAAGLEAADIDYWEINEAFCVVALNCIKAFGIDPDKVNIMGGGTAIGHPLGATGLRLAGTLGRILAQKNARLGCANACVGGGQGVAVIIENPRSA